MAFDGIWNVTGNKPNGGAYVSDSFSCGAGDDWVIVDPVDRVSSDCEHVGTRGKCVGAAQACAGEILITADGGGQGKPSAPSRARKPAKLGQGKFRAKGGRLMNQIANLNAKAGRLVAERGVVKATVNVTCTAKYKRRDPKTTRLKYRMVLASDPNDPNAVFSVPGKLTQAKCR
jgi:hypothetical protein